MIFVNYSLITAFRCKEASIYDLCANPLLPIALIVGNKKSDILSLNRLSHISEFDVINLY